MTEWLLLALSVLLIIACGIFVAGEFALLTADRPTVERAAADGDRRAKGVLVAFRTLSTQLSGVQVGITVTNLAVGFLSEPALASLLQSAGLGSEALAIALALLISTLLTMLFGELVPKNLAIAAPLATAKAVQGAVRLFTTVTAWPIRALNRVADRILGLFGIEAQEELASARSPEELLSLVQHSAREGTLAAGTAGLLARTLTFGDKRARDVLTPRPRMVTVRVGDTVADVLQTVRASGHSRLPVVGRSLDDIVGVVELDHAVAVPAQRRAAVRVRRIMSAPVEVPETLPLDDVLRALRAGRSQLAVVVDEYGGTAGLLTGEDLLEELVGELDDEHDTPQPAARRVAGGFDVSGLLRPDEVRAQTGLALPTAGVYETVGGLVMHALGRLPAAGDTVTLDDVTITVTQMDGRRVDRLLITCFSPRVVDFGLRKSTTRGEKQGW